MSKMKASKLHHMSFAVVALLMLGFLGAYPTHVFAKSETATVIGVIDGDTIDVNLEGRKERIRLVGIDTPELHGSNAPECYAHEAKARVEELVAGKTVTLIDDGPSADRDRYDRLLRYVVVDGESLNELLIRDGYAPAYLSFAFEKKDSYVALEAAAKQDHKGLWGEACASEQVSDNVDTLSSSTLMIIAVIIAVMVALGLLPKRFMTQRLSRIKK